MTTTVQFLSQWGPHHPGPHTPMGPYAPMGPYTGMNAGGAWGGFGFLPALGLLVALLAVLALGVYLFRLGRGNDATASAEDDALTTLRERFARGEIDAEEFEERRGRLTG
ncbi:MAG: SHOCT domain-containing protein [Haloferacaceae archaeon]